MLVGDDLVGGDLHGAQALGQFAHGLGAVGALAVGIAVPVQENVRQVGLGLPGRGVNGQVHAGLVGARARAENAQARPAQGVGIGFAGAFTSQFLKGVGAHEIVLHRFVQAGHGPDGRVEQFEAVREVVAYEPRGPHGQVDARSAKLGQGDDGEVRHPAVTAPAGPHPEQMEHLPQGLAVGPHDVVGQPVQGYVARIAAFLAQMLGQQRLGQGPADHGRGLGRHPARVQGIEVAPRGQDVLPAPGHDPGRPGRDMPAGAAAAKRLHLPGGLDAVVDANGPVAHGVQPGQHLRAHQMRVEQFSGQGAEPGAGHGLGAFDDGLGKGLAQAVKLFQQPAVACGEAVRHRALVGQQVGQFQTHGPA